MQELGSMNVPARAGAVVGLSQYARSADLAVSEHTTTLLVTQLATESDPRVLRVLLSEIVALGKSTLPLLTQFNRSSKAKLVTAVQDAMISCLPSLTVYKNDENGTRWHSLQHDVEKIYVSVIREPLFGGIDEDLLTKQEQEILATLWPSILERASMTEKTEVRQLFYEAVAGPDDVFGRLNPSVRDNPNTAVTNNVELSKADAAGIESEARSTFITSLALTRIIERIIEAEKILPKNIDLTGTMLFALDLPMKANLREVSFSDSFLSGDVSHANLSGAHFVGAQINHLNMKSANLSDADLSFAVLPDEDYREGTNLKGANWWAAHQFNRVTSVTYVLRSGKIVDTPTPTWNCPAPEFHTVWKAGDQENGTFRISECPDNDPVAQTRLRLEAAFPKISKQK
jgi:hypothetical protein